MGICYKFEVEMIKLLGLPEGVIWFNLKCAAGRVPTVECEYEVRDGEYPKIGEDGLIERMRKKYKVKLEEMESGS